jgi:hypothetical protein
MNTIERTSTKRFDFATIANISCMDAAYIDIGAPCELWHGYSNSHGYGEVYWHRCRELVCRVIYALSRGIPLDFISGLTVRHTCDNPRCFSDKHLLAGTQAQNIADSVRRGRNARGETNGHAKLTADAVRAIRAEYVPRSRTHGTVALSMRYGVTESVISEAVRGITWASVDAPCAETMQYVKLTPDMIEAACAEFVQGSHKHGAAALARRYGVSQPTMTLAINAAMAARASG